MTNENRTDTDGSECRITEHWSNSTVVVDCAGVFDILTAPEVERRIASVLGNDPDTLIIDLTRTDFLASHGMNVLIAFHELCAGKTTFAVVADGPVTRRPMDLIGITDLLTVYSTLDEALGTAAV